MEGYVLWQFVREFPDRVRAIVLCDTKVIADSQHARASWLSAAVNDALIRFIAGLGDEPAR